MLLVNDDDYERSDGVIRRSARSTRSDIENSNDPIDEFIDLSSSTTTTPFDLQPVRASPSIVPKNSHGRLTCARTLGPTSAWVGGLFRVRVVDVDVDLHSHGGVGKRARGTRGTSKFFTRKCVRGAPQRFRALVNRCACSALAWRSPLAPWPCIYLTCRETRTSSSFRSGRAVACERDDGVEGAATSDEDGAAIDATQLEHSDCHAAPCRSALDGSTSRKVWQP